MATRRNRFRTDTVPTMGNDNTGSALPTTDSMMGDSATSTLIGRVHEGMRVVDAAGEEIGRVDVVKMGDPEAATVGADAPPEPGFFEAIFVGEGEPALPDPLRSRLLRFGYLRIDGKGWIDMDRYVTGDLIARIDRDTVTLNVGKDRLLSDEV
jgi:hypothetical protein